MHLIETLWPEVIPDEIIDEMLKAFLHTRDAAIKVQAYGRGLLQRFRSHRLITKDFNRQANRQRVSALYSYTSLYTIQAIQHPSDGATLEILPNSGTIASYPLSRM